MTILSSVKEETEEVAVKVRFENLIKGLYVDCVLTDEEKIFALEQAVKYGILEEEAKLIIAVQERKLSKKDK